MTLEEMNNSGFYVQESMVGIPIRFMTIRDSFTPGHGTTDHSHYYSFIDPTLAFRYRLRQIDFDGTTHYSDTVIVDVPAGGIDLVEFTASPSPQQGVQLQWSTRRETENARFVVEASQKDSLHFRPIINATVSGHGTTTQTWKYTYRDTQRRSGVTYYRLKQVNIFGKARYTRNLKVTTQ